MTLILSRVSFLENRGIPREGGSGIRAEACGDDLDVTGTPNPSETVQENNTGEEQTSVKGRGECPLNPPCPSAT